MGRKYKYCSICRCSNDLMHCTRCRKAYHAECVNIKQKVEIYTCNNCVEERLTGDNNNLSKRIKLNDDDIIDNPKLKILFSLQIRILQIRCSYLKEMKELLSYFCEDDVIERVTSLPVTSSSFSTTPTTSSSSNTSGKRKSVGRPPKSRNGAEVICRYICCDATGKPFNIDMLLFAYALEYRTLFS